MIEYEQDTYVSFVPRKFGKIYPEEEKYYVVTYDRAYIGRVLKVGKISLTIKFFERRIPHTSRKSNPQCHTTYSHTHTHLSPF